MKYASSLILLTVDGKIVLQKRSTGRKVFFSGTWGLIGGEALSNEMPTDCILRECFEETMWQPDTVSYQFQVHEHCCETVFSAQIDNFEKLICCEGDALFPFDFDTLLKLQISDYHRRIINRFLRINVAVSNAIEMPTCIKTKKVLLYTKLLPPSIGGYISAGLNYARCLKNICDLSIACEQAEKYQANFDGIPVLDVNNLGQQKHQFDVLFFNATYENTDTFQRLFHYSKKVILVEHNEIKPQYEVEMIHRIQATNIIFVPSQLLARRINEQLKDKGIYKEVQVFPIPIDECTFAFSPHRCGDLVQLVTCGMIKPIRRFEMLFEVIAELVRQNESYHLTVIGDTPYGGDILYRERLVMMSSEMGLSSVIKFIGAMSIDEVAKILPMYDGYIDFSLEETFGQAKLEAIASGLDIFMPDIGNNAQLLPRSYSLLQDDVSKAAAYIKKVFAYKRLFPQESFMQLYNNRKFFEQQYAMSTVRKRLEELLYGV